MRLVSITAKVIHHDPMTDVTQVEVGEHVMQYGSQGDGYCFTHQRFGCRLTEDEARAVSYAEASAAAHRHGYGRRRFS